MSKTVTYPEVYHLHAWLREMRLTIWWRFLVCSDSTFAALYSHEPIVKGKEGYHLHPFLI